MAYLISKHHASHRILNNNRCFGLNVVKPRARRSSTTRLQSWFFPYFVSYCCLFIGLIENWLGYKKAYPFRQNEQPPSKIFKVFKILVQKTRNFDCSRHRNHSKLETFFRMEPGTEAGMEPEMEPILQLLETYLRLLVTYFVPNISILIFFDS
mmetsp:Transcript_14315/g.35947  ORF Transcript_14315/g.35947 Transcript_14315/m.35947 type:complete len:153 (-) Transcript_14315:820-1278(-)